MTEPAPRSGFGQRLDDGQGRLHVGAVLAEAASWRFTLEPIEGGTRLTQWMRMGPGRSGINPAIDAMPDKESKILHRRLGEHRANMEATLAVIKALAES